MSKPSKTRQKPDGKHLPEKAPDWVIHRYHQEYGHTLSPLDVMSTAMLEYVDEAERYRMAEQVAIGQKDAEAAVYYHDEALTWLGRAAEIARKAAPYAHARLTSLAVESDLDPVKVEIIRSFNLIDQPASPATAKRASTE